MRWHDLGVTLGLRYDLQRFRTDRLVSNPLWPWSGRVPDDTNNIAPRVAFAYAIGREQPVVVRGGWGIFYTRIPSIYTAEVEKENGLSRTHLFLDNADFYDRQVFPLIQARCLRAIRQQRVVRRPHQQLRISRVRFLRSHQIFKFRLSSKPVSA
jgi:hypothetical protein